jgi:predicted nucleic acid-binding protein
MNIVVADTGPLLYLKLSEHIQTLPQLFDSIVIPEAVLKELTVPKSPSAVREWAENLPSWVKVQKCTPVSWREKLDQGEGEALALALSIPESILLIDETAGRQAAREFGIPMIGTIGVLERAALRNLVDLPTAVAQLRRTNIFLSERIIQAALERVRNAKR